MVYYPVENTRNIIIKALHDCKAFFCAIITTQFHWPTSGCIQNKQDIIST